MKTEGNHGNKRLINGHMKSDASTTERYGEEEE